jgi:release factor glutamine methyltransferase
MDPSPYSQLLAETIVSHGEESALDMGSGSGLQAILMARCGISRVVAVDADSRAVLATEFNALLNGVSEWTTGDGASVSAYVGNLFHPIPERRFDLIVSNPPTFPSRVKSPRYTKGGEQGRQFLDSLIRESREHLNGGGTLQFVQSSLFDLKRTVTLLAEAGYTWKVVAERVVPFRPFYYADLWYFREEAEAGRAEYSTDASGACAETLYVIAARS